MVQKNNCIVTKKKRRCYDLVKSDQILGFGFWVSTTNGIPKEILIKGEKQIVFLDSIKKLLGKKKRIIQKMHKTST
jgi:hypothetical protein